MEKQLLIVEDEETIRTLLSEIFSYLEGYRVLCAQDGEEALSIVRENLPQIILMDVQLPKINGLEVCKSVKSDPATSHIKILILSGMVQSGDWQKAREAGADAFIAKPFRSALLIDKVEELLAKQ